MTQPRPAVSRAKSYFLVCAIVGNCLTFALGPKLLDDQMDDDQAEEHRSPQEHEQEPRGLEQDNDSEDEQTSLLPDFVARKTRSAWYMSFRQGKKRWNQLPPWIQAFLNFWYSFLNAPLIGAVIGAILGLVPPFHKAFFNEQQDGGVFNAWLTTSLRNIGDLFAALQTLVVGVQLSSSLRKMKRGEDSGDVPWKTLTLVVLIRFIIWPV